MDKTIAKGDSVSVIEHGVTSSCVVAHAYSNDRLAVEYSGIFIMADRIPGSDTFELSGIPATASEAPTFNALVATVETTTTVTKDEV
jgi:hypothetical protein